MRFVDYLPVNDVFGMHVVESKEDLVNDLGSSLFVKVLQLDNTIVQLSTLEQLRDYVEVFVIL